MLLIYAAITASLFCFLYLFHRRRSCKHPLMRDYPILGMLPSVLFNMWRIHDFCTEILKKQGGSGEFKGPWFTKMHYLITCDSLNVQHMLCKSFDNYIKGPEFREIFEPFGDGVVTADSETWKYFRTVLHSLIKQRRFETFVDKTVQKKVHTSLLPILDHVQQQGEMVDLQDVFNRFTFDNICSTIVGHDPKCLSIDFPEVAIERAFNESEESIFYRHTVPSSVWKFQKWLQIGQEKKMTEACKTLNQFIHACIASPLFRYKQKWHSQIRNIAMQAYLPLCKGVNRYQIFGLAIISAAEHNDCFHIMNIYHNSTTQSCKH